MAQGTCKIILCHLPDEKKIDRVPDKLAEVRNSDVGKKNDVAFAHE